MPRKTSVNVGCFPFCLNYADIRDPGDEDARCCQLGRFPSPRRSQCDEEDERE